MKKVVFLVGFVLFAIQSHAQIELTLKQKMMIKDVIEERVPKLINGQQDEIKLFNLDKIRVGAKATKIKGSFDVALFEQELFEDPLAFKTKLTYKKGKPGVKYLKVHKPGDNFLFFKRYQKLF